jgi:hypothetical protein
MVFAEVGLANGWFFMRMRSWCCFATALWFSLSLGMPISARNPLPPIAQSADESATLWGGEHIEIEFTKDGGTVEFDCATGSITKPLTVDAHGKFRASGTFTRERPGPTMRDVNPATAATYSGSMVGDTMHLHVEAGANKEVVENYVLARGQAGRVMKCR